MSEQNSGKEVIKRKCLHISQGGLSFYNFVINSKELREIAYVSRREMGNPKGYQRYLSETRLKEVGDYIKKKTAVFPNNLILNFDSGRAEVHLDPEGSTGVIEIKNVPDSAWVIDGQHRLWGFKYSDGKEFDLLVSAFIGMQISGQATTFRTINAEQKGVSTSLIYDLIDLTKDASYELTTLHDITKALNEDSDSPWNGQIKMTGIGPGIMSQAGMIRELKRMFACEIFKDSLPPEQLKMLKDYFTAIKELFPEAWLNKKYILCKTIGLGAIMIVMPRILTFCLIKNDYSKETMKEALKGIQKALVPTLSGDQTIDWSSDQLSAFSGAKGQQAVASFLEPELPKFPHSK